MSQTTTAYVVKDKTSPMVKQEVPVKPVGPQDVQVEMICSGLCHTDIHMQKDDWGISAYPTVLGHEGVGRVVKVGENVDKELIGQKVGIGWLAGSCLTCTSCLKGEENICQKGYSGTILFENAMGGTFQKMLTCNARFVYPIPEAIPSALAAPLLCAGITVYSPLRKYVKPGMDVGVISIGGLGHLAIQFAKAMGANVTAFSTSPKKKADAKAFGANAYCVYTDEAELKSFAATQDVILNTCPYSINLDGFVDCLRNDGVLTYIGLPDSGEKELKIDLYKLVFGQKTLAGSIVGGGKYMTEMFKLVTANGIKSSVTCVDYEVINETCDALIKGDLKGSYRYTMCWDNEDELQKEIDSFMKN